MSVSTTMVDYYACDDESNPPCRYFVNGGTCMRRKRCRFYHPPVITPIIERKTTRELGYCYCGAPQTRIMNAYTYRLGDDNERPLFFIVCSRTRRSMKGCL